MVLPDTQQIFDKKDLSTPKAQNRLKVFNLVVAKRTEFALIVIFILQFVSLILLWLYQLLTTVRYLIKTLNKPEHTGHPEGLVLGGLFGY